MDVLTDKSTKQYAYVSRYTPFSFYYNTKDEKYIYGITSYLNPDTSHVLHSVVEVDSLDSLAEHYYGRPDLYWLIADFNRIIDATEPIYGKYKTLKIPSLGTVTFKQD